jgi:hypothetical protein
VFVFSDDLRVANDEMMHAIKLMDAVDKHNISLPSEELQASLSDDVFNHSDGGVLPTLEEQEVFSSPANVTRKGKGKGKA